MERMDVFNNNFLVVGLPQANIDEIADLATVEIFAAGERIIKTGDSSNDLYVILEGNVNIVTGGDQDHLATAGPASLLGEISLVDAQPRSADAIAKGLTKVARLPAQELRRYMAQHKDAGFIMLANLARVLSMRLRNATIEIDVLKDKAREDPWHLAQ